ncbi:MAG: hypothetical protein J3K34DRAFT_474803 [Monoraphidium minutum]|nr:MAG: hypothetical protein J3K34DRAFT_474803 [Monoraphidium minutum]
MAAPAVDSAAGAAAPLRGAPSPAQRPDGGAPRDVLDASQLLGERGAALLQCYEELRRDREHGHDARVMARWEAQQAEWSALSRQLAAAAGKPLDDVTFTHAAAWRRKQELIEVLEQAAPPLGVDPCAWNMTLRNAHERYVQVGHAFSGLFLSVKSTDPAVRPLTTELQQAGPQAELIAVAGESAEAAAWGVCHTPVGLADAEQLLRQRDPGLYAEYEAQQQRRRAGPHLSFSAQRLVMTGVAGDQQGAAAVLTVTGTGTAAELQRRVMAGAAGPARFYLPCRAGVILPGEEREFVFAFRSAMPGIFTETWTLATAPPLPAMGMHHRAGDPVQVVLRGVAVPPELGQPEVARLHLEAGMRRRERDREVAAAVDAIISGLPIAPPTYLAALAVLAPPAAALETKPSSGKGPPPKRKEPEPAEQLLASFPQQWDGSIASIAALGPAYRQAAAVLAKRLEVVTAAARRRREAVGQLLAERASAAIAAQAQAAAGAAGARYVSSC